MSEELWESSKQRVMAYKRVFTGADGEKILEDLKRSTGFYVSVFDQVPTVHAFNEGQRTVAALIHTMVEAPEPPDEETEE